MALQAADVIVTGYVADGLLHRLYRTTTVAVAPLRYGGGVKGKIIEAMRFGVSVATTTAGAQGMVGWPDYLEIGDTADEFAAGVLRLLNSPELRRRHALAALTYIEQEYSFRSVAHRMARDIPELSFVRS
jgi:glycosyltransferase involved in cell wall biosynthesis